MAKISKDMIINDILAVDEGNAAILMAAGMHCIGCLAAAGIDYKKLGIQTGKMAAKILKGQAKASEMPFEKITDPSYYANTEVADKLGIDLPNTFTEKAEVFDTITVSEE